MQTTTILERTTTKIHIRQALIRNQNCLRHLPFVSINLTKDLALSGYATFGGYL